MTEIDGKIFACTRKEQVNKLICASRWILGRLPVSNDSTGQKFYPRKLDEQRNGEFSAHTVQKVPYSPTGHSFPVTVPSSPKCPSSLPDPPLQNRTAVGG